MKKILTSIFLVSIAVVSCGSGAFIGAGGHPVAITPAEHITWLFISNGESNSGGKATDPATGDDVPHKEVQILNNTSRLFERSWYNHNNNIGHTGVNSTTFGWEIELFRKVAANTTFYGDSVYYVQTGSGGSYISDWCTANRTTTTLFNTRFTAAVDTATKLLSVLGRTSVKKAIFLSIGINDQFIPTVPDSFIVYLKYHINNMRAVTGGHTPVFVTKFFGGNTLYNTRMDSLASAMDSVYAIDGTITSGYSDAYHWNHLGYATEMDRFLAIIESWF